MYNDFVQTLHGWHEALQMPWWLEILALLFVASSPLVIKRWSTIRTMIRAENTN